MLKLTSLLAAFILALGIGGSLSACNTVEGIGEDISAAARGVRNKL